ncbi:IPT/TIG domain-containing protein [Microbispora sp. NPDC049125]|uniref:IPT/TIG domain-containing protein n=1 Tax=Microbispora sp. NPDC049125 TaxID=3154929 RepID=UPI003465E540
MAPIITTLTAGPQGTAQGNFGQTLTITGTALTGVTDAKIGARTVPVAVNPAGTVATCSLPSGSGMVAVTVTGSGGTSNALPFYYIARPVVISLAPPAGISVTPPTVTITGRNLITTNQVMFDGMPAALLPPLTDTQITVLPGSIPELGSPPWTQIKDVSIRTAGGTVTLFQAFTFFDRPTVEALTPSTAVAGSPIYVDGSGFVSPLINVHFDGVDAAVVVNSSLQLIVTPPSGLSGTVIVDVFTLGGTSVPVPFTYQPG